jgi:hypothetical protein
MENSKEKEIVISIETLIEWVDRLEAIEYTVNYNIGVIEDIKELIEKIK